MTMDVACARLDAHALVRFDGAEAAAFLQGQLTCDVARLGDATSTYGAYCTPKGRALATFLLWPSPVGFFMQLPRSLAPAIQKRLSMYILRSKVRATDATADYAQFGVAGKDAAKLAEHLCGAAPAAVHAVVRGPDATAIRLPVDRYLLVISQERLPAAETVLGARATAAPATLWDALDIDAGIATVLPETQEQFVPQMLNLDAVDGVSFGKGCYPGQEIVARMHYLGRLKERMFRATIAADEMPRPGDKLYGTDLGAQASGAIANVVQSAPGRYDVLAVVRTSSVAAGPVHWKTPDGAVLAFRELPYALPEK